MQLILANLIPGAALSGGRRLGDLFQTEHGAIKFLRRLFELGRNSYVYVMKGSDHDWLCQKPDRKGGQAEMSPIVKGEGQLNCPSYRPPHARCSRGDPGWSGFRHWRTSSSSLRDT